MPRQRNTGNCLSQALSAAIDRGYTILKGHPSPAPLSVLGFHPKAIPGLVAAKANVRMERAFNIVPFVLVVGWRYVLQGVVLGRKHPLSNVRLKAHSLYRRSRACRTQRQTPCRISRIVETWLYPVKGTLSNKTIHRIPALSPYLLQERQHAAC